MKRVVCVLLILAMTFAMTVNGYAAKSKSEIKKEQAKSQAALKEAEAEAAEAEAEAEKAKAAAAAAEEQLASVLSTIKIIEGEMEAKQKEIEQAKADYEAAKAAEEKLYEEMCERIRYIYENGDSSQTYLKIFLESKSMADFLNRQKYTSELYEFDKKLLDKYEAAKEEVHARELALQDDLDELEEEKNTYEEQQAELDKIVNEQKSKVEDFESVMKNAEATASKYKDEISKQNAQIKQIEAEEAAKKKAAEEAAKKKAAEEAAKKKQEQQEAAESQDTSETPTSEGTAEGRDIASYAQQFLGNPYVSGGTSLTDGCDCSGFTQAVYAHFGYRIPRTSGEQAAYGKSVSYSDAEPGDIFCYAGHVGIYIGNNTICHASTPATGIKLTTATYRDIIAIRRII
ncbi:MAG: C40 family peptidase [Lachnospiraceae bacterium]|nr:C40 family peptidase [Lachnospiraceae bacterium]